MRFDSLTPSSKVCLRLCTPTIQLRFRITVFFSTCNIVMHVSTEQQQHQKSKLLTQLPSYARPTASSAARRIPLAEDKTPHPHVRHYGVPKAKTHRPEVLGIQKDGTTSVAPSLQSHRTAQQRSGFFDLPGELRNAIYELCITPDTNRNIDLHSDTFRYSPQATLPPLLQADERILVEAGCFYFPPDGTFTFKIDQACIPPFAHWFTLIGPLNRARLASNPGVTIYLIHNRRQCRTMTYHTVHPMTAVQITRSQPTATFDPFPVLEMWRLASKCPRPSQDREWMLPEDVEGDGRRRRRCLARTVHPKVLLDGGTKAEMVRLLATVRDILAEDVEGKVVREVDRDEGS